MDAVKTSNLEKHIFNRVDSLLLKISAKVYVDALEAGAMPTEKTVKRDVDFSKFLDLFDQILSESETARNMPRNDFRVLFNRILYERANTGIPNEKKFDSAIKREQQHRARLRKAFDKPTPPVACPLCLNFPDMVFDPVEEFDQRCTNPECEKQHHYFLTPPCHPGAGMVLEYCSEHRTLTTTCNKCRKPIAAFQLYPAAPAPRLTVIQ